MHPDLPNRTKGKIPKFNKKGTLPVGDFEPTEVEFLERFVPEDSTQRTILYEGFKSLLIDLKREGLDEKSLILVNGSFTTDKEVPSDLDIAVFFKIDSSAELIKFDPIKLLKGPGSKHEYFCDAYWVAILPESDPNYQKMTLDKIAYWKKQFGKTEDQYRKGRVWCTAKGFER